MEPAEETLVEEVRHDRLIRSELIIGGIALALLALVALAAWYYLIRPAPTPTHEETATTTPTAETVTDQHLDEEGTYYDIKAAYPGATSLKESAGAEADAAAVALMRQFEVDAIAQFKKDGNFANLSHDDVQILGLDQRKESLEITYSIKSSPATVSYVYTIYQDTLGAHPNTFFRTFTFDRATGARLTLADLFTPGTNYLDILSTKARAALPAIIAARENVSVADVDPEYTKSGTTPEKDSFANWYLENGDLVLIFPPYQVAPYAAGAQVLPLRLTQLPVLQKYR